MKSSSFKPLSLLIILMLCIGHVAAKVEKLTPTISWELTPDGTLTISGTGVMPDFKEKPTFWRKKEYEGKIKKVVISEGISAIGNSNFHDASSYKGNSLTSLTEVELPSTLENIGVSAFQQCGIETLTVPASVRNIWYGAFTNCYNLREVTFRKGDLYIWPNAFAGCKNLDKVDFADSKVTLDKRAFQNDIKLTQIINASNTSFGRDNSLSFAMVFTGCPVKEFSAKADEYEIATKTIAVSPIPDGEWHNTFSDGGIAYAGEKLVVRFTHPDPTLREDDIPAKYGYYESWGEGESTLSVIDSFKFNGDTAFCQVTSHTFSDDEKSVTKGEITFTFDKATKTVNMDTGSEWQSTMYDINAPYVSTAIGKLFMETRRGDDGSDRGTVSFRFYRDGDYVTMLRIIMYSFMTSTEVTYATGRFEDNNTIVFDHIVTFHPRDIDDINEKSELKLTRSDIINMGAPCEEYINYYNDTVCWDYQFYPEYTE